ncbi:MAG: glycosyltransferase [Firmicutes bacterium]|nr:glycosyltransferase [Bacillota bacterium]
MKILFAESHNLDRPDPLGSHHYIRLFQQDGHECCWLGPAISPLHIFKPDNLNRHRFKVWKEGGREFQGVKWKVPFTLAFYYNLPLMRALTVGRNQYRFCLPPLKKSLRHIGFDQVDLLWCAGPVAYSLLDLIPHRISCYRVADRLDQFKNIPPSVVALQKDLIRRVDFVVATSQSLFDWVCQVRRHDVYYLPNGVGDIFFQPKLSRPVDFPDTGLPVAIYLGTIDTRFDLGVIEQAVKRSGSFHFLLVGPITEETLLFKVKRLQQEYNFSWLGPKKQSEAISYLQHSEIGIIPFYLNDLTEAVNPIKYYEYLACGLPVVAPPLRELSYMKGPIHFYHDHDSFLDILEQAKRERTENQEQYTRFADENSWHRRYEKVKGIAKKIAATKELPDLENSEIWLSVVVIGRNEAKNLPQLFDSLPAGSDLEWLYIDSGSTDGSPETALKRGARVIVLNEQSVYAPATGRFVGTLEAKGRWVLYLDGDMLLSMQFKAFLKKIRQRESAIPAATAGFVGYTTNCYLDEGGNAVGRREHVVFGQKEAGSADIWGKPVGYHGGAVLYLRKAVLEAGNWNPALSQLEEIELLSRIKAKGKEVRAVDLPMVEHHTPYLSLRQKLLLNFLPTWRGKNLCGAGQVVAARLREGNLFGFIRIYPYPFLIFFGLATAPALYFLWPPLPLLVNLLIALWIAFHKRWYFYLVYLGNIIQICYGLTRYRPFKPGYRECQTDSRNL